MSQEPIARLQMKSLGINYFCKNCEEKKGITYILVYTFVVCFHQLLYIYAHEGR